MTDAQPVGYANATCEECHGTGGDAAALCIGCGGKGVIENVYLRFADGSLQPVEKKNDGGKKK